MLTSGYFFLLLSSHVVFPAHIFKHMPLLCVYPLQELTLISPSKVHLLSERNNNPGKLTLTSFSRWLAPPIAKGEETKISFFPSFAPTPLPSFDKEIWTTDRYTRKWLLRTREWCPLALRFLFSPFLPSSPFVSASGGGLKKRMISQDGRGGGRRGGLGEATTRKSAGVSLLLLLSLGYPQQIVCNTNGWTFNLILNHICSKIHINIHVTCWYFHVLKIFSKNCRTCICYYRIFLATLFLKLFLSGSFL